MSQLKINDVELIIDMEDYDFISRYESAFEKMEINEKELQKVGKASELIKGYCQMFYDLFDDIFGADTGNKLFGGKYNMQLCDSVYDEFITECEKQAKLANNRRVKLANKYKPKKR